jgi:soluble cytochrome b562
MFCNQRILSHFENPDIVLTYQGMKKTNLDETQIKNLMDATLADNNTNPKRVFKAFNKAIREVNQQVSPKAKAIVELDTVLRGVGEGVKTDPMVEIIKENMLDDIQEQTGSQATGYSWLFRIWKLIF